MIFDISKMSKLPIEIWLKIHKICDIDGKRHLSKALKREYDIPYTRGIKDRHLIDNLIESTIKPLNFRLKGENELSCCIRYVHMFPSVSKIVRAKLEIDMYRPKNHAVVWEIKYRSYVFKDAYHFDIFSVFT